MYQEHLDVGTDQNTSLWSHWKCWPLPLLWIVSRAPEVNFCDISNCSAHLTEFSLIFSPASQNLVVWETGKCPSPACQSACLVVKLCFLLLSISVLRMLHSVPSQLCLSPWALLTAPWEAMASIVGTPLCSKTRLNWVYISLCHFYIGIEPYLVWKQSFQREVKA